MPDVARSTAMNTAANQAVQAMSAASFDSAATSAGNGEDTAFAGLLAASLSTDPALLQALEALGARLQGQDDGETDAEPGLPIDAAPDTDTLNAALLVAPPITGALALEHSDTAPVATPESPERDAPTLQGLSGRTPQTLPAAELADSRVETAGLDGKDFSATLDPLLHTTEPAQAGHASPAQAASHQSVQRNDPAQLHVATAFQRPGWTEDVGHQLTWLTRSDISQAELILTPPHLGRVEVSIQVNADQVSASFVSASPEVRTALEQALPRLREVLAAGGMELGQTSVSSDSFPRDSSGQQQHSGQHRPGSGYAADTPAGEVSRRGVGLVDLFA